MSAEDAQVGVWVRTRLPFSGVPKGTCGIIDEEYAGGIMIAWDLPSNPLPPGYRFNKRQPWRLRDGFAYDELHCLEKV